MIKVDWKKDYKREFICPKCNQGHLTKFQYAKGAACKLKLSCYVEPITIKHHCGDIECSPARLYFIGKSTGLICS